VSLLRRLLGPERRTISFQSLWGSGAGVGASTASGEFVDEARALRLTAVYACVSLIADAVSTLPLHAYTTGPDDVRRRFPEPGWLLRPNPDASLLDLVHQIVSSLLLWGNAYVLVVRDATGSPVELWALPPDEVAVEVVDGPGPARRRRYSFRGLELSDAELLHIPAFLCPGASTGLSPIRLAKEAVGLALAAEGYGARFFRNGTVVSGVIEVEGNLDPKAARDLRDNWTAAHAGTARAHLPGVLSGGAKWKPISIPNDDAQWLETRRFQVAEIARLFRCPPHMIGDVERSTSWGTGIEEQGIGFVVYCLRAWTCRVEGALSSLLPAGAYLRFSVEGLLRGNTKARYESYAIGRQWGWLSANDVLRLEDRPPVEGGDVYLVPTTHRAADEGTTLLDRVNAVGQMIRSGFDPVESLALVGLDPVRHLGLPPVTVQTPDGLRVAVVERVAALEDLRPDADAPVPSA
jgi:HK97 family phage portal protein